MKYKLIHSQTKEEYLCDKVTIDGFDYYVSDDKINSSNYEDFNFWFYNPYIKELQISCNPNSCHKVIATNNPNIDIPKVVDEVEKFTEEEVDKIWVNTKNPNSFSHNSFEFAFKPSYKAGYNKSQETHPFSEGDMIEFGNWISKEYNISNGIGWWLSHESNEDISTEELFRIWKEQRIKPIYYE